MGQWDNRTAGGERQLAYPPTGEAWDTSGPENLETLDEATRIIGGVSEQGSGTDFINIEGSSTQPFHIFHKGALSGSAGYTIGASDIIPFDLLNETYTAAGGDEPLDAVPPGRLNPLISTFDTVNAGPLISAQSVGISTGYLPPFAEHLLVLAIWDLDPQGVMRRIFEMLVKVAEQGL